MTRIKFINVSYYYVGMDYSNPHKNQSVKQSRKYVIAGIVTGLLLCILAIVVLVANTSKEDRPTSAGQPQNNSAGANSSVLEKTITDNPLAGKDWYVDTERTIAKQAATYRSQGKNADADLLDKAAKQPSATWLVGPNDSDKTASRDINEVKRTSSAAAAQGTVPLYQLYAMPQRDACAGYSKGGFQSEADYEAWVKRILDNLQAPAVFSVEADAVGHTIRSSCLSPDKTKARYALLNRTVSSLQAHPKVLAVYLDAAHSDWFADPTVLVGPLRESGIDKIRGVSVNVSNFIATPAITEWSQKLAKALGNKGVLIDTSRNGQGAAPGSVQGDARWCNPAGRGLGPAPTTSTRAASIDAYAYIKTVGESDGDCFGNPPAGTFMPAMALELARNARQ